MAYSLYSCSMCGKLAQRQFYSLRMNVAQEVQEGWPTRENESNTRLGYDRLVSGVDNHYVASRDLPRQPTI
ncbi:Uncharacterized protein HZ326_0974 [Fusarium oxysporum f. sp. albedinis]|nr:Uncharacterized protein HZ326_0974 [Fusarium oxysporum f. sp. albedinis]